ncbi:hypothetical protein C0995_001688 [Termitomyces sp. Mi166|nr:hypothetical protein C0995_001688 [Termitomyces sp. Mi166\
MSDYWYTSLSQPESALKVLKVEQDMYAHLPPLKNNILVPDPDSDDEEDEEPSDQSSFASLSKHAGVTAPPVFTAKTHGEWNQYYLKFSEQQRQLCIEWRQEL